MKVNFDRSFYKSLDSITDPSAKQRIAEFIHICENATHLHQVPHIKKLRGFSSYYRYRIGNYRVGFELSKSDTLTLIIACHRRDIYRFFP